LVGWLVGTAAAPQVSLPLGAECLDALPDSFDQLAVDHTNSFDRPAAPAVSFGCPPTPVLPVPARRPGTG
jgi:hypothetical protein